MTFCYLRRRTIVKVLLGGFRAFSDVPFLSICLAV